MTITGAQELVAIPPTTQIVSTETAYARGTSALNAPTSGWQSVRPEPILGQYIWVRETIHYNDDTPAYIRYIVEYYAKNGRIWYPKLDAIDKQVNWELFDDMKAPVKPDPIDFGVERTENGAVIKIGADDVVVEDGKKGDKGDDGKPVGENLLCGTSLGKKNWRKISGTYNISDDGTGVAFTGVSGTITIGYPVLEKYALRLLPGKKYTFSFKCRLVGSRTAVSTPYVKISQDSGLNPIVDNTSFRIDVDGVWHNVSVTVVTRNSIDATANQYVRIGSLSMFTSMYVRDLKLEEGDTATAWCLSEEDKKPIVTKSLTDGTISVEVAGEKVELGGFITSGNLGSTLAGMGDVVIGGVTFKNGGLTIGKPSVGSDGKVTNDSKIEIQNDGIVRTSCDGSTCSRVEYGAGGGGGGITSVNGKTDSAVTLNAGDVGAFTKAETSSAINSAISAAIDKLGYTITLEQFGGGSDKTPANNTSAFKDAIQSVTLGTSVTLVLQPGKTYTFTDSWIDLSSRYGNLTIIGNGSVVRNLAFKYNIKAEGASLQPVGTSAVDNWCIHLDNIHFGQIGRSTQKPVIFTAGKTKVTRCSFMSCGYCIAYPVYYVDYFLMQDCYFSNKLDETMKVLATFETLSSPTETTDNRKCRGDWFIFERCHFAENTIVYEAGKEPSRVFVNNCLHGQYITKHDQMNTQSRFHFNGCHFEIGDDVCFKNEGKYKTISGGVETTTNLPLIKDSIVFENCYFWAVRVPDEEGILLKNCEISFSSASRTKSIAPSIGSFTKTNNWVAIYFDRAEFVLGEKPSSPLQLSTNSYTVRANATVDLKRYTSGFTASYCICTSFSKDRLTFGKVSWSDIVKWSDSVTIGNTDAATNPCNKTSPTITFNTVQSNVEKVENIYLHVFRRQEISVGVGSANYSFKRAVIPITRHYYNNGTNHITFADEPTGIMGCRWETITDQSLMQYAP